MAGGGGGQIGYGGGRGDSLNASIAVTPGQTIVAIAGGQGGTLVPGLSAFGSGGAGLNGGGGGGGASALYLDGALLAVAAGGGGGSIIVGTAIVAGVSWRDDNFTGNANTQGKSVMLVRDNSPPGVYASRAGGGLAGTASGPGAGGIANGTSTSVSQGKPGVARVGGNGAVSAQPNTNAAYGSGGGGGGGGGFYGGGGGSSLYWNYQATYFYTAPGGGGGGYSFISPSLNVTGQAAANQFPGYVVVRFT